MPRDDRIISDNRIIDTRDYCHDRLKKKAATIFPHHEQSLMMMLGEHSRGEALLHVDPHRKMPANGQQRRESLAFRRLVNTAEWARYA